MTSKNTTNITGSTVGAMSTGDHSQAHGSVTTNAPISQAEYERIIQQAQVALVLDQGKLDRVDALLYEGLSNLLRVLRNVQLGQTSLAEQVERMKTTLDDLSADSFAAKLRGHGVADGLEFVKALGTHIVAGVIVEAIRGS